MDQNKLQNPAVLQIKISNKDRSIYVGEAYAVSSRNEIGNFDILGEHANFVSVIQEYVDIHKDKVNRQRYAVDRGILTVRGNIVEIFIGI